VQKPPAGPPPRYDERFSAAIAGWLCAHERCGPAPSG
jgi:hypothetical protein